VIPIPNPKTIDSDQARSIFVAEVDRRYPTLRAFEDVAVQVQADRLYAVVEEFRAGVADFAKLQVVAAVSHREIDKLAAKYGLAPEVA
jgi:hypothetical protein